MHPSKTPSISPEQIDRILREADLLYTPDQIDNAYDRIAATITKTLGRHRNPLILAVPIGGLFASSEIISRLDFALEVDYIHATRYRGDTTGKDLRFLAGPRISLEDRTVIIIDDILDEGETLAGILDFCRENGAHEVYSAVLVEKDHDRKSTIRCADFTGLMVEDRYVFGCGMDYKGYLRNVRGIHAVKGL
uniref:Hypoxanthine phosphoribosyltransferase n=1 Tax=Candidatus Kentrum sp. UNK TaxID=2126344 RepID=A0A451A7M3_9GAMM|nr:MAG: hypoxanthine phosphoribosyltransferase [Candidatus Kentron sp. UNK]VFK70335.1 MAG: hypoxanthine phosphoribosyltransferase [Candidatus Kentron sp. UNK]